MHLVKEKKEISQEQKLELLIERMSCIKDEFVAEFGEFTKWWIIDSTQKMMDSMPEITRNLSEEETADIHSQSKQIALATQDKAKDLAGKINWWHQSRTLADSSYYCRTDNLFADDYRQIIGRIGTILQEYGYLPKQKMSIFGFSYHKDGGNRYRFFYTVPIDWSGKLKRLLDNYNDCYLSAKQI